MAVVSKARFVSCSVHILIFEIFSTNSGVAGNLLWV